MTMSRAVTFDTYGDRDVLYLREREIPTPKPGEVVVRMRAAGINPGEVSIRSGAVHARLPATFPSGQGSDLAGTIVAVGDDVTGFAVGEDVLGWSHRRSSHADHIEVPADQLIAKPEGLDWLIAGSLYVAGCTAYAAARSINTVPGETVAVSAAAGGVGTIVTQLLVARGVTVLGIASAASADTITALGAIPVAYGDGLGDRLTSAAPGRIDAFIDLHGAQYVELAIALGIAPLRINTIIAREAARKYGTKNEGSMAATSTEVLSHLVDFITAGMLQISIAAAFPLAEVRDAYALLEQGRTRGKIVLVAESDSAR